MKTLGEHRRAKQVAFAGIRKVTRRRFVVRGAGIGGSAVESSAKASSATT
jgi:hypothetical protein